MRHRKREISLQNSNAIEEELRDEERKGKEGAKRVKERREGRTTAKQCRFACDLRLLIGEGTRIGRLNEHPNGTTGINPSQCHVTESSAIHRLFRKMEEIYRRVQ